MAEVGPYLIDVGAKLAISEQGLVELCQCLAKCGAEIGPHRTSLAEIAPNLGTLGSSSTDFDRGRPHADPHSAQLVRCRPSSARFGQSAACIPQKCTTLVPELSSTKIGTTPVLGMILAHACASHSEESSSTSLSHAVAHPESMTFAAFVSVFSCSRRFPGCASNTSSKLHQKQPTFNNMRIFHRNSAFTANNSWSLASESDCNTVLAMLCRSKTW